MLEKNPQMDVDEKRTKVVFLFVRFDVFKSSHFFLVMSYTFFLSSASLINITQKCRSSFVN